MKFPKSKIIKRLRERVMKSRTIALYYKAQTYIDIGWGELSWWNAALIELMAILYVLEKIGVVIVGSAVVIVLVGLFVMFFLLGIFFKASGLYDKSVYIETEIDPVDKINLEASKLIIKHFGDENV